MKIGGVRMRFEEIWTAPGRNDKLPNVASLSLSLESLWRHKKSLLFLFSPILSSISPPMLFLSIINPLNLLYQTK